VIEVLNALGGKHGEMDIQIKGLTLEFMGTAMAIRLNGLVTVNVRLSELSEREKKALEREGLETLGEE
jgi:hypothetical protein